MLTEKEGFYKLSSDLLEIFSIRSLVCGAEDVPKVPQDLLIFLFL